MASPTYLDRAAPSWVRALLGVLALCAALYAVLLVGVTDGTGLPSAPESWWPLGVLGVAAGVTCAARAASARGERLVWALLGSAIASYGSGFLVWALVYQDDPTPPYPSTHNLGTNRMSANPRDGVVNKFGQTHDVANLFVSDGSQFTTGGAENPTLTIVSLAIRQADYIAGQMSAKSI